jgi:sugar phosphate isomerase/epimerase
MDRVEAGAGIADIPRLLRELRSAGFDGWYDLEIFSDDGSFTDQSFEDSLWKQDPLDVVQRAKEGFEQAWAARKAPA